VSVPFSAYPFLNAGPDDFLFFMLQYHQPMKIAGILEKKRTLSFEVFPPRADAPMDAVLKTLSNLDRFKPDFISCTYGAGGSNRGRNMELCAAVKNSGHELVPHLPASVQAGMM
jgi:5,10-methylenetetrahydrofolate reductase